MAAADGDADGEISYDEFVNCYGSPIWQKAQVNAVLLWLSKGALVPRCCNETPDPKSQSPHTDVLRGI